MATSGGFGGGPSLPMTGDMNPAVMLLALVLIGAGIFFIMKMLDV